MYKQRTSNLFDPQSDTPYPLSRYRLDLFRECPRCFYLDRRLGIDHPSWPAFTLNSAVDTLFKQEFDIHRVNGEPHPLMENYGIEAVPFDYPKMDEWRHNFKGVRSKHEATNFIIFGAIDDLWVTPDKELFVVDYKSTSTSKEIDLNDKYKQAFKKQVEIYQWLLRRQEDLRDKGYKISDQTYFVYANAGRDRQAFDRRLEFDVQIIAYEGDDSWVEDTIKDAHQCLMEEDLPDPDPQCEYCRYRQLASKYE